MIPYCDHSLTIRKLDFKLKIFPWFVRCSGQFARIVWFLPLFYQDRFIIIILWLGLFPDICINVFLLICFCSVYVICLFGRCSRLLDPALDTCPLKWNIISFAVNFHYMYHDHCLSWIVISKKKFLLLDVIVQSFMVDYFWFPTSFFTYAWINNENIYKCFMVIYT